MSVDGIGKRPPQLPPVVDRLGAASRGGATSETASTPEAASPAPVSSSSALETAPAPPSSPAAALAARLASLQLRLVDARTYLSRAFDAAPLVATSSVVEEAAARSARAVAGGADPTRAAHDLVGEVLAQGGLTALAALPGALESHVRAVAADLGQPTFGASLLDAAARAALARLPQETRSGSVDRGAAMRSMIAAAATLDGQQTAGSVYVSAGDLTYGVAFDCWTNESGLGAALEGVAPRGGAAVGVSGALLDVAAATRADFVLSTDSNPEIKDFFLLAAAVLLVVDAKGDAEGWDASRRASEVRARLCPSPQRFTATPDDGVPTRTIVAEVEALGWPPEARTRLPALVDAVRAGDGGNWTKSDEGIAHLTGLACEGRIVATTTDLADPGLAGRLDAVLAAHGTTVSAFHVSNAFDYIVDAEVVLAGFRALPRRADALVTSSSEWVHSDIGTFEAPRVAGAEEWLAPERAQALVARRFTTTPRIQGSRSPAEATWKNAMGAVGGNDAPAMPGLELPTDLASFRDAAARYAEWFFGDDGRARARVVELATQGVSFLQGPAVTAMKTRTPPHSLAEARRAAAELFQQVFTPDVRRAIATASMRERGGDPAVLDDTRVIGARSLDEIRAVVRDCAWEARQQAESGRP